MDKQQYAHSKLINFLSSFPQLNDDKIKALASMIPVIAPKKGAVLLSEGETPKECYFVLQGVVRQYQFIDGTERTTEFYTEKDGSVSSEHYTEQTPATFYLECVEDCLLIAGNIEIDAKHYEQFPELIEITKSMIEDDLNRTKKTLSNFIVSSPTERYLNLLETRPELFSRAPLHQIASYLGITAESISRIRKRIVSKKS